ncbi:MAG: ion channel [Desulfurococcales archaeon]|nr:ion channel [Desulfurococcales archaeon]
MIPAIHIKIRRIIHRLARRRFLLLLIVFALLWVSSATLFYRYERVSGVDFATSLYWALITMATVGYGDVVPSTSMGRVVASVAAVFGIAVYTLFISTLADYFMEATVKAAMGLGILHGKRIIVIGEGPVCDEAVRELVANGLKNQVGWLMENQPKTRPPVDYIVGGLDEEDLKRAGVEGADYVLVCYNDDSKAIHAAALVKGMNPRANLTVLAKDEATIRILRQMKVDNIVPMAVLGRLLASATFEPSVTTFLSDATTAKGGIDLAEYSAKGKTVREVEEETGYRVVALIDDKGRIRLPKPEARIKETEKIVVLRETRGNEEGEGGDRGRGTG